MVNNKMKKTTKWAGLVAMWAAAIIYWLFVAGPLLGYSMENHPIYIWFPLFWLLVILSSVPMYGSVWLIVLVETVGALGGLRETLKLQRAHSKLMRSGLR